VALADGTLEKLVATEVGAQSVTPSADKHLGEDFTGRRSS
jgi:hypothetical protein